MKGTTPTGTVHRTFDLRGVGMSPVCGSGAASLRPRGLRPVADETPTTCKRCMAIEARTAETVEAPPASSTTMEFIAEHLDHVIAYTRDTASSDLLHVAHGAVGEVIRITTLSQLPGDPAGVHVHTRGIALVRMPMMNAAQVRGISDELDTAAGR